MATKQKRYRLKVTGHTFGKGTYNPYNIRSGCNETDIRNNPDIPASVKKRILGLREGTVLELQKQSRCSWLTIQVVGQPKSDSNKRKAKAKLRKLISDQENLQAQLAALKAEENRLRRLHGV